MITLEDLKELCRCSERRLAPFVEPLNSAMQEFEIDNPRRIAAFLAQIAHESGSFQYVREIASGSAYDTGRLAERLGNTPEDDDDGEKYRGRGLLQITGTDNYRECGNALGLDLLASPELLERFDLASRSAAWYWNSRGLNELADKQDFRTITKKINGGFNHYGERVLLWARAKEIFHAY